MSSETTTVLGSSRLPSLRDQCLRVTEKQLCEPVKPLIQMYKIDNDPETLNEAVRLDGEIRAANVKGRYPDNNDQPFLLYSTPHTPAPVSPRHMRSMQMRKTRTPEGTIDVRTEGGDVVLRFDDVNQLDCWLEFRVSIIRLRAAIEYQAALSDNSGQESDGDEDDANANGLGDV